MMNLKDATLETAEKWLKIARIGTLIFLAAYVVFVGWSAYALRNPGSITYAVSTSLALAYVLWTVYSAGMSREKYLAAKRELLKRESEERRPSADAR